MSDNATTTAVPVRSDQLTVEQQGDGFYSVLAGAAGRVLITNNVGRLVLDLCDGERDTEQISAAVVEKFSNVPSDQVRSDVQNFITSAIEKEALTWRK